MKILVSDGAAGWYVKELELKDGAHIRFFPRYSSGGGLHPGFSLGISTQEPVQPGLTAEAGGITFFMEEQDLWYMRGYDLYVEHDESQDDISYIYKEETDN